MLKACRYCGRIHDSKADCGKKPIRKYRRKEEEQERYTYQWRLKSERVKEDAGYLCQMCAKDGRFTTASIEVHHIRKMVNNPDLIYDDRNLVCLCNKHHREADAGIIPESELQELARRRIEGIPPGVL